MAEHQQQRSSKKSKGLGLFGKVTFNTKGKMRYQRTDFDDEESLMYDDKHDTTNNYYETLQTQQNNDKTEVVKRHSREEVLTKETERRNDHSSVQLTDLNPSKSEVVTAAIAPENACVVKVNAIIESNDDNDTERHVEENETDFLVTPNEFYKSETCLLQDENSSITSHFVNLSVAYPETAEACEVQINPGAEYNTEESRARTSRAKENAIKVDNVEVSPTSEATSRCSTHATNSKNRGRRSPKKKKNIKQKRKSSIKDNLDATSDDETSSQAHCSTSSRDPETIEILTTDNDVKKEKQKKQRKKAKRFVAKAGLTMWKGIRSGWKLMWNGLSMYTLPLGSLDVTTNITKFWSAHNNSSSTKP